MAAVDERLVRRERRPRPAADAAVRSHDPESRLHPGLRAGRSRERRAVHARRALDRHGVRAARRRRPRGRAVRAAQPGQPFAHGRGGCAATAPNRMSSQPMSTRCRRTPAAAAGHGTRGRPGGCIASGSKSILGISLRQGALHIDPCIPRGWPRYEVTLKPRDRGYDIVVENPDGVSRGVKRVEVDGVDCTPEDIPVVEDGARHAVRVVMDKPRVDRARVANPSREWLEPEHARRESRAAESYSSVFQCTARSASVRWSRARCAS